MAIGLPHATEIPLQNPPVTEVIAQVRFPPLLSILKEPPIEFQESIRQRFPQLTRENTAQIAINNDDQPSLTFQPPAYRFGSAESESQAALSAEFFAVSTKRYTGWRRFLDDLTFVHAAVVNIYNPSYASRVGLRYVNHLTQDNTGIDNRADLLQLVRPELSVTLHGPFWENADEMISIVSFGDGEARLNLRYGFSIADASPIFVLDFDYFEEGTIPLGDVLHRFAEYHATIYDAFRWCILPETVALLGGVV
jgi:uncharacterized protein (TIGR04255 family)